MMKKPLIIAAVVIGVVLLLVVFYFFKPCTVSFDTKGGTIYQSVQVRKGNKINKPNDPVMDGYTFKGWYLNDEEYDFSKEVNGDIMLTAKWEENSN